MKHIEVNGEYTQASGYKVKIISKWSEKGIEKFIGRTTTPNQSLMIFDKDGNCITGNGNDMIYGIR